MQNEAEFLLGIFVSVGFMTHLVILMSLRNPKTRAGTDLCSTYSDYRGRKEVIFHLVETVRIRPCIEETSLLG